MKKPISFTTVLSSKRQSRNLPKSKHQPNIRHNSIQTQPVLQWSSLAQIMQAYEMSPHQQYILYLNQQTINRSSQRNSILDRNSEKNFGNFDQWIEKQTKGHQNKQNIADVQPRLRQNGEKSFKNKLLGDRKDKNQESNCTKKIILNRSRMGIGKLCEMYNESEIENSDPVWKCNGSSSQQSQSQSQQGMNSIISGNSKDRSFYASKDPSSSKSKETLQSKNLLNPNNSFRGFTEKQSNDLKDKFARIKNQKMEELHKIKQQHPWPYQNTIPIQQVHNTTSDNLLNHNLMVSRQSSSTIIKDRESIKQSVIREIEVLANSIVEERKCQAQAEEDQEMLLGQDNQEYSHPNHNTIGNRTTQYKIQEARKELSQILKLKNSDQSRKRQQFFNGQEKDCEKAIQLNIKVTQPNFYPYFNHQGIEELTKREPSMKEDVLKRTEISVKKQIGIGYSFSEQFPTHSSLKSNLSKAISSISNSINNSVNIELQNQKFQTEENSEQLQNIRNFKKYVQSSNSKILRIESIQFDRECPTQDKQKCLSQSQNQNQSMKEIQSFPEAAEKSMQRLEQQVSSKQTQKLLPESKAQRQQYNWESDTIEENKSNFNINQSVTFQQIRASLLNSIKNSVSISKEQFIMENSIPGEIIASGVIEDDTVVQEQVQREMFKISMTQEALNKALEIDVRFEKGQSGPIDSHSFSPQRIVEQPVLAFTIQVLPIKNSPKSLANSKKGSRVQEIEQYLFSSKPENSSNSLTHSSYQTKIQNKQPIVENHQLQIVQTYSNQTFPDAKKNMDCNDGLYDNSIQQVEKKRILTTFVDKECSNKNNREQNGPSNQRENELKISIKLEEMASSLQTDQNLEVDKNHQITLHKRALINSSIKLTKPPLISGTIDLKSSSKMRVSLMKQSGRLSNGDQDAFELQFDFD